MSILQWTVVVVGFLAYAAGYFTGRHDERKSRHVFKLTNDKYLSMQQGTFTPKDDDE